MPAFPVSSLTSACASAEEAERGSNRRKDLLFLICVDLLICQLHKGVEMAGAARDKQDLCVAGTRDGDCSSQLLPAHAAKSQRVCRFGTCQAYLACVFLEIMGRVLITSGGHQENHLSGLAAIAKSDLALLVIQLIAPPLRV